MTFSTGFRPAASSVARVLILGNLPGAESLRHSQYYANPHNRFWWIMGKLCGADAALPYDERLAMLADAGIALWDVCAAAERSGSLDSAIRPASVVPNDLGAFLSAHLHVKLICFNGGGAARMFDRLVLPRLAPRHAALPRAVLPSTSPAHAAMPPREKLAQWSATLSPAMSHLGSAGTGTVHLAFP